MKIALSNIALPPRIDESAWQRLAVAGLNGVEVALTRIAPWDLIDEAAVKAYRESLHGVGLCVPSLQAILYGVPNAQLLQDETRFGVLIQHLRRVARLGQVLGAKIAVFGAPKQRNIGSLEPSAAFSLGVERFRRMAQVVSEESDIIIALEPAPPAYGGDFLTTAAEVRRMADTVSHLALRINLDTGCAYMVGENFHNAVELAGDYIAHVQISEPALSPVTDAVVDHFAAALALHRAGYGSWLSIEMLEPAKDALETGLNALAFVRSHYLQSSP